jgi:outer membrane protein OmpA-like peptidoglycan-associated protein
MMPSKLLFAVDTDQLGSQQADYVNQLAQDLKRVGIQSVRVEGHTDDTGPVLYNQQLSERRAQRVAEQLVRAGMDPCRSAPGVGATASPAHGPRAGCAAGEPARGHHHPAPVGP